jgi:D-tyrosyl-tRNA(Tyr) deacylase
MIAVTQVVNRASVRIVDKTDPQSEIEKGLIVFLGISQTDTEIEVSRVVNKLTKLRVFPDENGKMNLDINQVNGEILLISQFTILGNLKGNNRPDFTAAADKELASSLYELFADKLTKAGLSVKTGFFGEHMEITPTLSGPVTIILDSDKI